MAVVLADDAVLVARPGEKLLDSFSVTKDLRIVDHAFRRAVLIP